MWMKAMCVDWTVTRAKIRYSAAVKQEHGNGRISPHGELNVHLQAPCTCEVV